MLAALSIRQFSYLELIEIPFFVSGVISLEIMWISWNPLLTELIFGRNSCTQRHNFGFSFRQKNSEALSSKRTRYRCYNSNRFEGVSTAVERINFLSVHVP